MTDSYEQSREQDDEILAGALGTDNKSGYHVEMYYQASLFWNGPRHGDGTRFPCIDAGNHYSGCLGVACEAMSCWAGKLVPSAVHARRPALPRTPRKGAQCHHCAQSVQTSEGLIDCAQGHFDRPVTLACLLRRRVPDTVPIPCPDLDRDKKRHKR